jgi:N-acetylglutamate synthase-like GNAT family acetyltransferase
MAEEEGGRGSRIRGYDPGDLEACRDLWVELTVWHRRLYDDPSIGGEDPGRSFDAHLEKVGAGNLWVAEAGGRVVGLAGLIPREGEGELEPLVVAEGLRGVGIGQRLAAAVIEAARARGFRYLSVKPVARNAAAIQYFHSLGFNTLGQIELFMDLGSGGKWRAGEWVAGVEFRV